MSRYNSIAGLVSKVRNARYGEMVNYLERLINSGDWRDFTTPAGTHFQFQECEFDYFLLSMEVDPTIVRHAYLYATDVEELAAKQFRLADITGRGKKPREGARRPWREVATEYESDPSGAAARICAGQGENSRYVNERTAQMAADPKRRRDAEAGKPVKRNDPKEKVFQVKWKTDRPAAEVIAEKLLKDRDLAEAVYKKLRSSSVGSAAEEKRVNGSRQGTSKLSEQRA
jgi:hypothetical protein